jgi:hypothetical protein
VTVSLVRAADDGFEPHSLKSDAGGAIGPNPRTSLLFPASDALPRCTILGTGATGNIRAKCLRFEETR